MNGIIKTKICLVCKHYEVCDCKNPYFLEVEVDLQEFLIYASRRFEEVKSEPGTFKIDRIPEGKRSPISELLFERRVKERKNDKHRTNSSQS